MHSGHRERLKEQFINDGFNNMKDYHILELLLFYAIPRCDTKPIAHKLIDEFGTLANVFDAQIAELMKVSGIKEHSAVLIKMIPQIMRRYLEEKTQVNEEIGDIKEVAKMLVSKYIGINNEQVYLVCMNNKNQIINTQLLYEGTVTATEITARKVIEISLRIGATKVILSHNHPKSSPLPSNADIMVTDAICSALKQVGIKLVDHIIVSGSDYISMSESGLIKANCI